jgi:hypothetical protein
MTANASECYNGTAMLIRGRQFQQWARLFFCLKIHPAIFRPFLFLPKELVAGFNLDRTFIECSFITSLPISTQSQRKAPISGFSIPPSKACSLLESTDPCNICTSGLIESEPMRLASGNEAVEGDAQSALGEK